MSGYPCTWAIYEVLEGDEIGERGLRKFYHERVPSLGQEYFSDLNERKEKIILMYPEHLCEFLDAVIKIDEGLRIIEIVNMALSPITSSGI